MSAVRPAAIYQEGHSALSWPLLAFGLLVPAAAEVIFVALAMMVNPDWLVAVFMAPLAASVLAWPPLLYRNWPTGIRIDESAISIGAVRSGRALRRKPTVMHQGWGMFTCQWRSVESVRVVTDRAELRQMKAAPRYYTFTNRWGGKKGMRYCNVGVLAAPFMRAALVIDLDPYSATVTEIRPARLYSNFKDGEFSHRVGPRASPTWVVPTRRPEALSAALAQMPGQRGMAAAPSGG